MVASPHTPSPTRRIRDLLPAAGYARAVWAVLTLGVVLRLVQYLSNRSLWMDEAFLTLNILGKSFSGLFGQLGFNQAAPPGFLLVERVDVHLFGKSEYALRLFPLLCGVASLFLFARLAARLVGRIPALVALVLFSLSSGLVYYSAETKQYATDVAVTLLLALGGLALRSPELGRRRAAAWAVLGAAAVWFSHPSPLVVAAVALLLVPMPRRRSHVDVRRVAPVIGTWAASAALALAYERTTLGHILHSYAGSSAVAVLPPGAGPGGAFPRKLGFFRDATGALNDALGVPTSTAVHNARYGITLLAVIGFVALVRRNPRIAAFVTAPVVGVLIAAAAHVYPVLLRTILFLLPFFLLLVVEGIDALGRSIRRGRHALVAALAVAVAAAPAAFAGKHLFRPVQREEMRPVLRDLVARWQTGDKVAVLYQAQFALRYYLECDCLFDAATDTRVFDDVRHEPARSFGLAQYAPALRSHPPEVVVAQKHPQLAPYLEALLPLAHHRRVWLIETAVDVNEQRVLDYLACVGSRRERIVRRAGSGDFESVTLERYDLSRWQSLRGGRCSRRFGLLRSAGS